MIGLYLLYRMMKSMFRRRQGMDWGMLIKIVIWIAMIILVTAIIVKYIAGTGTTPLPGEELLT